MLTPSFLLAGTPTPPPEPTLFKCGVLSFEFDEGVVRNIRLGNTLLLQAIYCAVRDQNWTTIPAVRRILREEQSADAVTLVFESVHQQDEVDFIWTGTLHLTPTQLSFDMAGEARSTFKKNRIGFCVLHDASLAGQPCVIEHTDGRFVKGQFPAAVAPHQPYLNVRAIEHAVEGAKVNVRMEGDTFEMEDQRNWSDASYKTYCTILALPFPVVIEAGTKIQQRVTLSVFGSPAETSREAELVIRATGQETPLPKLGVCLADESVPLAHPQLEALRALMLDHLRVDLEPASPAFEACLAYAQRLSLDLAAPLEVALWLNDTAIDLQRFNQVFQQTPLNVARWLVFHRRESVTSAETAEHARRVLQSLSDAPLYGGTDDFFTQLNRNRPDPAAFDGLTYSTNPQVHAFDHRTLIEALETQGVLVTNARHISADKPIAVSPITLKMRSNPDATSQAVAQTEALPDHVDPRQMSLFAAGWTLGSLKHQAQAGAGSLTYFTTHGLDGLMDPDGGSSHPDAFPTVGGVYPLYWVFYEITRLKDARVLHMQSSHPRLVDALTIIYPLGRLTVIANYTASSQTLTLEGLKGPFQERELSLETLRDKDTFLTQPFDIFPSEGSLRLTLPAYTLLFLKSDA